MSAKSREDSAADGRWMLTSKAFERLLRAFDPDRESAAQIYEELRERVIGLFQWWGAMHPDELADLTFDRVARKLEEGTTIPSGSLGAYVRGVARMVCYESRRDPVETGGIADVAAPEPSEAADAAFACLERCLDALKRSDRDLVLAYYGAGKKEDVRQRLCADLGISITALRIRTHRLRVQLEACVSSCLGEG